MEWQWGIPAVTSVFGGIQGYNAGLQMQDDADEIRRLAEKNRLLAARELQEQVRRQAEEDYRIRSAALARAAASGAEVSGSVADYLDHMEGEQARQLRWLRTAGASRIRLDYEAEMRGANALETRGKTQQWGSLISGFTQAFSYMDRGGWFEKATDTPSISISGTYERGRGPVTYPSGARGYPVS